MLESANKIGENAGKVWQYLSQNGEHSTIQTVAKGTELTRDEVSSAIGWLAREGKLHVQQRGKSNQTLLQLTDG